LRRKQVAAQAQAGRATKFITLTVNPLEGEDADDRAVKLARAWRLLVKRIKRYYGYKTFEYFCVFEATKKGEPHLHILARVGWISQKWLSKQLKDITNAPVVDIRKVQDGRHVAHYLAKYVGKEPGKFGTCKRYWATHNWTTKPKPQEVAHEDRYYKWKIEELTLHVVLAICTANNWIVERKGQLYEVSYGIPP